jgi:hypothetical protein
MEKRLREKRKVCDARMFVCAEIFQKFFENFFEKNLYFYHLKDLALFLIFPVPGVHGLVTPQSCEKFHK